MEIDKELKKENDCTSKEIFQNIECEMKSIHEGNAKPLDSSPKDENLNDSKITDGFENGDDNAKNASTDGLALTQTELREIDEISALKFTPSSTSLKLSEETDESQNEMSPVKTNSNVKAPTSGGKHLAMLFMLAANNLDKKDTEEKATVTDTESGSSEEISNEIDETKNDEASGIDELVAVVNAERKPVHTLASDDFEPDYEPDD